MENKIMNVKQTLLKRKKEIEKEISSLRELEKELSDIEDALEALKGPQCSGCSNGCSICRTGFYNR